MQGSESQLFMPHKRSIRVFIQVRKNYLPTPRHRLNNFDVTFPNTCIQCVKISIKFSGGLLNRRVFIQLIENARLDSPEAINTIPTDVLQLPCLETKKYSNDHHQLSSSLNTDGCQDFGMVRVLEKNITLLFKTTDICFL